MSFSVKSFFPFVFLSIVGLCAAGFATAEAEFSVPETVYQGELASFPGAFAFQIPAPGIILINDEQLRQLAEGDTPVDLSLTYTKRVESLRQICEQAQAAGYRTLILSFDYFFTQYREGGQTAPRLLTPDRPEYVELIAKISRFVQNYGLGLELSLLSPLEIGNGYREQTGESGRWMHFRKGLRDPESGEYSVELWRQRRWANNKGVVNIEDAGIRVFAFQEHTVSQSPYKVVPPDSIVDISDTASVQVYEHNINRSGDYEAVRIRVHGSGGVPGKNRVLVVQHYTTPEMDYFSDSASVYLKKLGDCYADAGVVLNGLYSDEMHIQQDWNYFGHHDHGQFAVRYVSKGFEKRFAELYGEEYKDFAKYMIYFVQGQEDAANNLTATLEIQHVFGASPEDIRRTALFRSNYYRLIQNGVVDLFTGAKKHLEMRMGHLLQARAHATWAESPTIDHWYVEARPHPQNQYEYTSNFLWSCTVHQAASACHDYFKWNDFLTGGGNDHTEGGWLDRDYFGAAVACSTGILNRVPYAYAAHWGMPGAISERRMAVIEAFGASGRPMYGMVQDMEHRDVDVLMLYPLDLVAANERFGSWMTQYAYANYVTQEKLLEEGRVEDGAIILGGRKFTTLVTLFEPFPEKKLLRWMEELASGGGTVIWSGPPPVVTRDGAPARDQWNALTGAGYEPTVQEGLLAPGRQIRFSGALGHLPEMTVLTDFTVDRIYPVQPSDGTEVLAREGGHIVGTRRHLGTGSVSVLAFRPRDDQSRSLGYETRFWFEILHALGAYPATGIFGDQNDNTEYLSRTTPYICCRFPNGALAVAPHLRELEECWPGGFARKEEEDQKLMERLALPPNTLHLDHFKIDGREISYDGMNAMTFRADASGKLLAFAGQYTQAITVDGTTTQFADQPMPLIAWAPLRQDRKVPGGASMLLYYGGAGTLRLPCSTGVRSVEAYAEGATPASRGSRLDARVEEGNIVIAADAAHQYRWIYICEEE